MKVRCGFVSNSSSTSFIIKNRSDTPKTLVDFAEETSYLCEKFNKVYQVKTCANDYLEAAKERQENGEGFIIKPGEQITYAFGDEQGDTIGRVCDYMLRDGANSKSFSWCFHTWLR